MTITLSPKLPARRIDQTFYYYRLVAAETNGLAAASAYAGRQRIHHINADNVEEAVQAMEAALQARIAHFAFRRDAQGWPSAEEYREVLLALPSAQRDAVTPLLKAHARLPDARAAVPDLARITGADKAALFTEYRKLGRRLFTDLRLAKQRRATHQVRFLLDPFAICNLDEGADYPIVQLRPTFVEALV